MKNKTFFVCSNCGQTASRWQGKCPECDQWNTLEERSGSGFTGTTMDPATAGDIVRLSELKENGAVRFSTGLSELDVVLGGGLVPGALVLLGGDPGIGKSTLGLQVAINIHRVGKKVLYVSGEESAHQIKLRSTRLASDSDLLVLPETNLEIILATLVTEKPAFAIIDSIQTLSSEKVGGVVGGVSQIAYATNSLMRVAKACHITTLVIGHVTKEGILAGPKTLEHMVDTVLYLEGERFLSLRLLRCNKNRFGSSGEVGVFDMAESGLVEIANPASLFLENTSKHLAGSCTTAILEGNRVLLLEVQALTSPTNFGYPRRTTSGFDLHRLQLIVAILQKNLGVNLSNQDVYINVAGGFVLNERAADLPVALAILSSFKNTVLPQGMVAFGEIGLLGEVRQVSQAEKRIREADKLGLKDIVVGGSQVDGLKKKYPKQKISGVGTVKELLQWFK